MSRTYKVYIEPINIYGKDLDWERFREILYVFIQKYRPRECLEVDIVNLLIKRVDKLMNNINNTLYYLNKYYTKNTDIHLVELLTEGADLYRDLTHILRKSAGKYSKESSPDRSFIKKLLGIEGHLFKLFTLIDNIEVWNKDILHEFNK